MLTTFENKLQQIVTTYAAGATFLKWWPMRGGCSAEVITVQIQLPNEQTAKWIIRQLNPHTTDHAPNAAAEQFNVQQIVHALGITVPKPIAVDESRTLLPKPFLILEFIEGEPIYSADISLHQIAQIAKQLAAIHQIGSDNPALAAVPQTQTVFDLHPLLKPMCGQLALPKIHCYAQNNPQHTFLHGDLWPGNLLWQGEQLAAVIDWEDAKIGNPLEDLAISRFDIAFIFGRNARHHFTTTYLTHNPLNTDTLPYWDLRAANRYLHGLPGWSEDWPDLGRPEITAELIQSEALWSAEQAVQQLRNMRPI